MKPSRSKLDRDVLLLLRCVCFPAGNRDSMWNVEDGFAMVRVDGDGFAVVVDDAFLHLLSCCPIHGFDAIFRVVFGSRFADGIEPIIERLAGVLEIGRIIPRWNKDTVRDESGFDASLFP